MAPQNAPRHARVAVAIPQSADRAPDRAPGVVRHAVPDPCADAETAARDARDAREVLAARVALEQEARAVREERAAIPHASRTGRRAGPAATWYIDTLRLDTRLADADGPHWITLAVDSGTGVIQAASVSVAPPTAEAFLGLVGQARGAGARRGALVSAREPERQSRPHADRRPARVAFAGASPAERRAAVELAHRGIAVWRADPRRPPGCSPALERALGAVAEVLARPAHVSAALALDDEAWACGDAARWPSARAQVLAACRTFNARLRAEGR